MTTPAQPGEIRAPQTRFALIQMPASTLGMLDDLAARLELGRDDVISALIHKGLVQEHMAAKRYAEAKIWSME